jgi:dihydroflavonol-4-reductase
MRRPGMKVFLTGGTGFIGSRTAERLARAGHDLNCLVRKESNTGSLEDLNAALTLGDLSDRQSLLEGMSGCDWVINIAAAYSFWLPRKQTYSQVNVAGTRNVMECALLAGVSKVVHISTAAVYGKPQARPFNEESPVGPVRFSEYARTKYEGDLIAWRLHDSRGLPLVIIYPGGVLGPDDPKPTGEYIRNVIDGRMPVRVLEDAVFPWVHVRDVAEVIVRAAEKKDNLGEKYLAVGDNLTFGEINRMISDISGVPLPRVWIPDSLVMAGAVLLTLIADVVKRPPPWGMAADQIRTMKEGAEVSGAKAQNELGIEYTPIRVALEEAIASFEGHRAVHGGRRPPGKG